MKERRKEIAICLVISLMIFLLFSLIIEHKENNITAKLSVRPAPSKGAVVETGFGVSLTKQQLDDLIYLNDKKIEAKQQLDNAKSIADSTSSSPAQKSAAGRDVASAENSVNSLDTQLKTALNSYGIPESVQRNLDEINDKSEGWTANYNEVFVKSDNYKKSLLGLKTNGLLSASESNGISLDNLATMITTNLPASFDWRNVNGKNYITSVKNQKGCGSCWAFASIGAFEASANIYNNKSFPNLDMAEQDLVSCFLSSGCNGANKYQIEEIFSGYFLNNGISKENYFPYTATNNDCKNKNSKWSSGLWKSLGYESIDVSGSLSTRVKKIKQALINYGPVAVGMAVYPSFYSYSEGIYSRLSSEETLGGHVVLIVGYGSENKGDYWIVKNSWGTGWGEEGYFKIRMGSYSVDSWFAFVVQKPISSANFDAELKKLEKLHPLARTSDTYKSCKDSDEKNLYVKGKTNVTFTRYGFLPSKRVLALRLTDFCLGNQQTSKYLREFACKNNKPIYMDYECLNGCYQGTCKK